MEFLHLTEPNDNPIAIGLTQMVAIQIQGPNVVVHTTGQGSIGAITVKETYREVMDKIRTMKGASYRKAL